MYFPGANLWKVLRAAFAKTGTNVVVEPNSSTGKLIVQQRGGATTKQVQISHDGTNGIVVAATGALQLGTNCFALQAAGPFLSADASGTRGLGTVSGGGVTLVAGSAHHAALETGNTSFGVSSGYKIGFSASSPIGSTGVDSYFTRLAAAVIGTTSWLQNTGGRSRITTANVTNATTTMAALAGLSATLIAGRKYSFKLCVFCTNTVAADGLKFDFDGGTATMTSFRAHATLFDTALLLSSQTSALATDFAAATVTGDSMFEVHGGFVCNGAGTFLPRFANNNTTTGVATAYIDSWLWIEDVP